LQLQPKRMKLKSEPTRRSERQLLMNKTQIDVTEVDVDSDEESEEEVPEVDVDSDEESEEEVTEVDVDSDEESEEEVTEGN
jgi:hypothetical protein